LTVPVSILIPTLGRPRQLSGCLDSVAACSSLAAEVVVADQSEDEDVARVVTQHAAVGARRLRVEGRGISLAMNAGLRACEHDTVLVTHDDCVVDSSWVGEAWRLAQLDPEAIVTGRVLPGRDGGHVPSTTDYPHAHDYSGGLSISALFPNNMVLNRRAVLAFGGFDERLRVAAEDNDLCYRWLKAGRRLRYEPTLLVWHRDWRSPAELERLYRGYYREQGRFYAKHLRAGDLALLRFVLSDVYRGGRGYASGIVRRRSAVADARPRLLRGLLPGLVGGWRQFRRGA
jgi:GT2 family glycosyltransferase